MGADVFYPHVKRTGTFSAGTRTQWSVSPLGEHKVVPADAIVIERSELPEVDPGETDGRIYARAWVDGRLGCADTLGRVDQDHPSNDRTPAWHRARALAHLAIAEYLDAHPPADEAQVEALTRALVEAGMDDADGPVPAVVARRMVARGVRIEVKP